MLSKDELKSVRGKFRVVGVDTFDHSDWIKGDYDTKEEAIRIAEKDGEKMLKTYVYDDKGNCIEDFGEF